MATDSAPPVTASGESGAYVGTELELFAGARNWKAYWSAQLRPLVRGRVLDVGAGIGATARVFADSPVVESYLALEPDAHLVAQMALASTRWPRGFETQHGTSADLAPGRLFDTILYIDVLEHIAEDRAELARAAGHLAPGGHILVLSPAHAFLYSPFDAAIGHERRYDRDSLSAAVPPGLAVERLFYLDAAGLLASLGNRLLLRASMPSRGQIAFWDNWLVPVSGLIDPITGYRLGKSIVAVLARRAA